LKTLLRHIRILLLLSQFQSTLIQKGLLLFSVEQL